jgi:hypothetical protein
MNEKSGERGKENQWFRERERDLLEQASKERERRLEEFKKESEKAELEKLRAAHWLKCPKCGQDMKVTSIDEIEVEQCTICEGIYFDRGELESLLLRKTERRFKFYRRLFGLD